MWAYVDESGCTGMQLEANSSLFFTVTAVVFRSKEEVTKCYERIEVLRAELRLGNREFHFNKASHQVRMAFL